MTVKPFKTWHEPLSPEAKAENLRRITERHEQMLAMGPHLWAMQGRMDKVRYRTKQSQDTDGDYRE